MTKWNRYAYYDVNIGRNRRFSLSYDQLREVAEMDEMNVLCRK